MKNLQHWIIPSDHVDDYLKDKSPVTPINIDYLDKELSKHPNALFRDNLSGGFRVGFLISFEGPRIPVFLTTLSLLQNILLLLAKIF